MCHFVVNLNKAFFIAATFHKIAFIDDLFVSGIENIIMFPNDADTRYTVLCIPADTHDFIIKECSSTYLIPSRFVDRIIIFCNGDIFICDIPQGSIFIPFSCRIDVAGTAKKIISDKSIFHLVRIKQITRAVIEKPQTNIICNFGRFAVLFPVKFYRQFGNFV